MTDSLYSDLNLTPPSPGVVHRMDGTLKESPYVRSADAAFETRVDSLFGGRPAYTVLKSEKPEHRLMLWMSLKGNSPEEISKALGYHVVTVRLVRKQPWFREAFVKLSTEFGKSAVETFLQSEALPALERVVSLATDSEVPPAVQLTANREILDRAFGKPVAKVEASSTSTTLDLTVADVATLLAERATNEQKLRASGIVTGAN